MKRTISLILTAAMLCTLLLTILSGCANENNKTEKTQEYESACVAGITINNFKNKDLKIAIIDEINISNTMSEKERQEHGNYRAHKISDIKEFYYPGIEIDGYELSNVELLGGVFSFYYSPIKPDSESLDKNGDYFFCHSTGIILSICRTDYKSDDMTYPVTIEQLAKMYKGEVKGDLIYVESLEDYKQYNEVVGLLGDTWFNMYIPKSVDFNTLPNIGRQLIKSAELVDVEHELDVMRNSTD